jgi:sugar-specific transcriptional regulator TrmB
VSRPAAGLHELLTEHGVGDKASRLYLAACRAGPVTASELARLSATHRVEAYRIIKELVHEGLLESTAGRPQRFAALPPDQLLERWIQRASDRLKRLERDRPKLLADWEVEKLDVHDTDARRFAILDGTDTIRRFVRTRLGTAEREILLTAAGPSLAGLIDSGFDRALKQAADRAVKVRLVTEVDRANLAEAKHFASLLELRHSPAPIYSRSMVLDGTGALVFVSGEAVPGETPEETVAIWSSVPAFVRFARQRHRRLWTAAQRVEERFVEVEDPSSATLPVVAGRESVPFQRLKEIAKLGMKASGVRSFQLDLPDLIGTIARQLGREIADEVDGRTVDEVVRSLADYYAGHTMGRLSVVRTSPLTMRVSSCFACTSGSPEIGREMCPVLIRSVLESKLGTRWGISKPDPTKHAARGCQFVATPS